MANIYQQIGDFQNRFREYFIRRLNESGFDHRSLLENRPVVGRQNSQQLEFWDFKNFIINHRELFRGDFGAKVNNLPTWLDDLREIRNKVAHFVNVTPDDEKEVEILIKKISTLAGISTPVTPRLSQPQSDIASPSSRSSYPELDEALSTFPALSKEPKGREYKVRRSDMGRGSIWITMQRAGYRIVTTGSAHCCDRELERLTQRKPKTWPDRGHCGWNALDIEQVRQIFQHFSEA